MYYDLKDIELCFEIQRLLGIQAQVLWPLLTNLKLTVERN